VRIISILLVIVFHHSLARVFLLRVLNLGRRSVLAKEFDLAPVHPPPVASLGPLIGIRAS
jgi:hypothetical protein